MSRYPRLVLHLPLVIAIWALLSVVNSLIDPLWSYYLALTAMYATAMMGMVILVGLSGQVSLGNGALMAVGGYAFAVSSMRMTTVPLLGLQWNAVWSMVFAGVVGVVVGAGVGAVGARLRGPYLAGLTLGLAVGIPAVAARFPSILGGSQGLLLQVPYPVGGYAAQGAGEASQAAVDDAAALEAALGSEPTAVSGPTAVSEPTASVAAGDMLTLEDVTVGGAAETSIPAESPVGADPTVASEDMLTLEDVTVGGADVPVVEPSASPTEMTTLEPTSVTDFVLEQWQASVAIALACIMGFVALNLVRGRQGKVWRAVRDDHIAASISGIHPGRAKVSAFVVSSLFAALAGAVFVQILAYAGPGAFGIGLSLSLLVGVVLGGRDSLIGAILGATLLVGLPVLISQVSGERGWPENVTANAPSLIYGLLVVVVVVLLPGGVVSIFRRARR